MLSFLNELVSSLVLRSQTLTRSGWESGHR